MRNYRDLQVWKKSHNVALDLYRISQDFPREELYGMTSQIRRAAIPLERIWQKDAEDKQAPSWRDL
jgi:hypothetical protein